MTVLPRRIKGLNIWDKLFAKNIQPFNAWCPLKGHTYLNKPEAESLIVKGLIESLTWYDVNLKNTSRRKTARRVTCFASTNTSFFCYVSKLN